jgi:hypothetical protein
MGRIVDFRLLFRLVLTITACFLVACEGSNIVRVPLGTPATFSEPGDTSKRSKVKCLVTVGQSFGKHIVIGGQKIDQLILGLRIENMLPEESVVSIGPFHLIDQKGEKHDLVLHTGPFYSSGGGSVPETVMVFGPITGVAQGEINLKANEKKLIPIGKAFHADLEPAELLISVGNKNKKQIVAEFAKQTK